MALNANDRLAINRLRDKGFGRQQIAMIISFAMIHKLHVPDLAGYICNTYDDIREVERG